MACNELTFEVNASAVNISDFRIQLLRLTESFIYSNRYFLNDGPIKMHNAVPAGYARYNSGCISQSQFYWQE